MNKTMLFSQFLCPSCMEWYYGGELLSAGTGFWDDHLQCTKHAPYVEVTDRRVVENEICGLNYYDDGMLKEGCHCVLPPNHTNEHRGRMWSPKGEWRA